MTNAIVILALCCIVQWVTGVAGATYPEYPRVVKLYSSNYKNYLPDGWQRSDLIKRSESTEIVTLEYQGPDESSVDSNNKIISSDCPHSSSGLKRWHYGSTWPGSVPQPGKQRSTITLPPNTKVFIDKNSLKGTKLNPYPKIIIPASSSLIFDDEDIELHTMGIQVRGKLLIGSDSCRIRSKITITLHGVTNRVSSSAADLSDNALKAILVTEGGQLDIHGARYGSTWTRLALTARKGDTKIVLQEQVNWEPGQRIVLTTTNFKDSRDWHRNEERVISDVQTVEYNSQQYGVVTFTTPLSYDHYGGREYQAEVGLLSRRVKIQGDDLSEATDTSKVRCTTSSFRAGYPCEDYFLTGYGGHVAIIGTSAVGRVSGTEFYRMGQTNTMGRYPFHFHMIADNGYKSYLQDSSIWHSFYRCVSVHGTHHSRLSRNVAYDIIGSCFYLEDAVEEENLFEYNLAAHIHVVGRPQRSGNQFISDVESTDKLLVSSDVSAAGFYITNAYNTYIGNAASGGYHGFAFPNVPRPLGLHADQSWGVYPSSRPTLLFKGNSCHSAGYWWHHASCIYVGGELVHPFGDTSKYLYNPGRILGGRGFTNFQHTKVFLSMVGINHWGSSPEIKHYEAHDVAKSANVFGRAVLQYLHIECRSEGGFPYVEKHYGSSSSTTERKWWGGAMRGFAWYDTGQRHIIADAKFKNCNQKNTATWEILTHSSIHVPEWMQSTARISYENCDDSNLLRFSSLSSKRVSVSSMLANWMDTDGTVGNTKEPTIIGSLLAGPTWWYLDNDCVPRFDWNMVLCKKMKTRSIASLMMEAFPRKTAGNGYCGSTSQPCPIVGYANRFGMKGPLSDGLPLTYNEKITGAVGGGIGWFINFERGAPKKLQLSRLQQDVDMVLAFPYPKNTVFSAYAKLCSSGSGCFVAFKKASTVIDFINSKGSKYFVDSNGNLYLYLRPQRWGQFSPNNPSPHYFSRAGISVAEMPWFTLEYEVHASCVTDPLLSDIAQDEEFCRLTDPVKIPDCRWNCKGSTCAMGFDPHNEAKSSFCKDGGFEEFYTHTDEPTKAPTPKPTKKPTDAPTPRPTRPPPTRRPTRAPTQKPTKRPTDAPTPRPTRPPRTQRPTRAPTEKPTKRPTDAPTPRPTRPPPTPRPTRPPPTRRPTRAPTQKPTKRPTPAPTPRPNSY